MTQYLDLLSKVFVIFKLPGGFKRAYPKASFEVIHPENFFDWLAP